MRILKFCLISLIAAILVACFPSKDNSRTETLLQGHTMGTTYSVKVVVAKDFDTTSLQEEIDARLKQLNQEMSTYIQDSEISLFNHSKSTEPTLISSGLARVITEALRLGRLTKGKLDVTVGPLVNLWGFGPEHRPETIPSDDMISAARNVVGIDKLSLNDKYLSKSVADLYVDLSTIAKGYGVDLVAEYLESQGITNYLVEIGGELRLKGFKHTGELWHVAIEKPMTNERTVHQVIVPGDNAVATSGDYRIYYEVDGTRFSHIIDPDTGKPIDHRLVSVTVIHPSSMTADGLSTAMMVMGEEQAFKFASENNIAAYLISKTDDGFNEQITVKFAPYLK